MFENVPAFIEKAAPGLLASIYALALPFTPWDDRLCVDNVYSKPAASDLWSIAYRCLLREMQFPKLSTIQTCILLLNQPVADNASADTPAIWSLASSTLAVAQSLGLHIDPTNWSLPNWEIRLRRRLWWMVMVEHSWRALSHGRFSFISPDHWNVSPLNENDFLIEMDTIPEAALSVESPWFTQQMCALTMISEDVLRTF